MAGPEMTTPTPPPSTEPRPAGFLDTRIPHVDGLRAVAILAVVGFHAGLPGFRSGFVGVDIFFVISGFLIINQIAAAIAADRFSVWEFYARRVLRILPMFLLVLLVSLGLSLVILVSPYEWEWFGLSGGLAALFVSNHYFLSKQDYFDLDMYEKSLLHTWSLSVEEQFYLCVPLLLLGLVLVARRLNLAPGRVLAAAAIVIFGASLAGCILLTSADGKNVGFYVALWRAWEFVAGGAIGFFAVPFGRGAVRRPWAEALGILGCLVIAAAVGLGLDGGFYPGAAVLLPVIGTVMLIAAGLAAPDTAAVRALSWRPMVGIGLVSYGWYLWHWPLLSLARIADFGREDQLRDVILAGTSLGLAILTYVLVERRVLAWRRSRADLRALSPRIVGGGVAFSLAVFALMAAVAGPAHYSGKASAAIAGTPDLAGGSVFACAGADCPAGVGTLGFLGGDSHADTIRRAVRSGAARIGVGVISPFKLTCPDPGEPGAPDVLDPTCPEIRGALADILKAEARAASFFVVFRRWNPKLVAYEARHGPGAYARKLSREFAAYGADGARRLLLIGPVPEFDYKAVECVLRAKRYRSDPDFCALPRARIEAERKKTMAVLARIAEGAPHIRLADPIDLFCDATTCRPYVGETLLYKDTDHLSKFGARWFLAKLERDFLWAFTGRTAPFGKTLQKASSSSSPARHSGSGPR
jgi:peptidoglycan/LPS O-acetylase OafA/YrhL